MNARSAIAITCLLASIPCGARAQTAWRVDAAPTLDLSSSSKSGAVLFTMVTGATRLQDGTLIIADRDDNALHYFDATGKPLRTVGRAGSGPGEFRRLTWMGRCGGDSLHIWDLGLRRMAVFTAAGTFVRQYFIPSDTTLKAEPLMTLACASGGTIAFQGAPRISRDGPSPKDSQHPTRAERVVSSTAPVFMVNTVGQIKRRIGDLPSGSMYGATMGGGFPLPLGTATYIAMVGDRLVVGTGDSTSTLAEYRLDGTMTMVKLSISPRPTTPKQWARAVSDMASMAPKQMRQIAEDSLALAPMPSTLPRYSALFGDADGILWVQLTVAGDPATRLRAIGTDNKTLGEISLPANVTIHEIGRDYILGAYDDSDDIPHFVVYRLHRGR